MEIKIVMLNNGIHNYVDIEEISGYLSTNETERELLNKMRKLLKDYNTEQINSA